MRYILISLLVFLLSCKTTEKTANKELPVATLNYLALGDSYTIGEMVKAEGSFPFQLVAAINSTTKFNFAPPQIIAKTGWRSDELLKEIKLLEGSYDLVSVLIGVNNQYQGKDIEKFRKEFKLIVEKAISLSKKGSKGVFVYSIPNYGVMPYMRGKDTKKIRKELKEYNSICGEISKQLEVSYYNITEISEKASFDSKFIADDKLHPSEFQYKMWVDETVNMIISNQLQ